MMAAAAAVGLLGNGKPTPLFIHDLVQTHGEVWHTSCLDPNHEVWWRSAVVWDEGSICFHCETTTSAKSISVTQAELLTDEVIFYSLHYVKSHLSSSILAFPLSPGSYGDKQLMKHLLNIM